MKSDRLYLFPFLYFTIIISLTLNCLPLQAKLVSQNLEIAKES